MTAPLTSKDFGTRVRIAGGETGTTHGATELGDSWIAVRRDCDKNKLATTPYIYQISELEIIEEKVIVDDGT